MKKNFFSTSAKIIAIFFLITLNGCATTKSGKSSTSTSSSTKTQASKSQTTQKPQVSSTSLFSTKTLSNNIPLIIKKNSAPFIAIRFLIEGGVPLLKESYSGLESVTLELMLKESKNFSAEKVSELEKTCDFSIDFASKKDYSYIELKCAEKDFSAVFPLFADRILNPSLKESAFQKIIEEKKAAAEKNKNSPAVILSTLLRKAAYKKHPYVTSPFVTPESLEKITLDTIKQYHKKILVKEKISLIAVGNFLEEGETSESSAPIFLSEVVSKLDSAFGKAYAISELGITLPEVPQLDFYEHDRVTQKETDILSEECYAAAYFQAPDRFDSDYVPFVFAGMIIDDILFDEVKHKSTAESSVKSLGFGIMDGKDQAGVISVFEAKTSEGLIESIDAAISAFPKANVIRRELNRYKKDYIMALYEKNLDVSGVADNITTSIVYAKTPTKYLERPDQVEYVSAKQISEAYKKYFDKKANQRKWILLTGKISSETEPDAAEKTRAEAQIEKETKTEATK